MHHDSFGTDMGGIDTPCRESTSSRRRRLYEEEYVTTNNEQAVAVDAPWEDIEANSKFKCVQIHTAPMQLSHYLHDSGHHLEGTP